MIDSDVIQLETVCKDCGYEYQYIEQTCGDCGKIRGRVDYEPPESPEKVSIAEQVQARAYKLRGMTRSKWRGQQQTVRRVGKKLSPNSKCPKCGKKIKKCGGCPMSVDEMKARGIFG